MRDVLKNPDKLIRFFVDLNHHVDHCTGCSYRRGFCPTGRYLFESFVEEKWKYELAKESPPPNTE